MGTIEQLQAENERLRQVLKCIHDLATYDEEERDEPSEDEMVEALCEIHELSRAAHTKGPVR